MFHGDGDQQALVVDIGVIEYWIGLNDIDVEGTFVWADGTTFDFATESNFNDGEPNNSDNEDCVEAFGNNGWNDLTCDGTRRTVCPLSPSFNRQTDNCQDIDNADQADSDDDGVGDACDDDIDGDTVVNADDGQPTNSTACRDSDGDGCDDCANGTPDPANDGEDTDADGICDDSLPAVCTLQGSAIVCDDRTAADAAALCTSLGLSLPVFHNDDDQQALVADVGVFQYWIGLNDINAEGAFVWADGTTFDFATESNFNGGEPNDFNNEDCVEAIGNNGWNDTTCDGSRRTVCPLSPTFNRHTDNCQDTDNADQADSDDDGVGDACDNCVDVANADQADDDDDGVGNACEI